MSNQQTGYGYTHEKEFILYLAKQGRLEVLKNCRKGMSRRVHWGKICRSEQHLLFALIDEKIRELEEKKNIESRQRA